jgi:tetratricopeptide (TPR) repeat protein
MRPVKHAIGWFAAVVLLAGCGGKEERLSSHLEKGKALMARSEYDRAGIEVKNALQIDPRNADAYYLAGALDEQAQNYPRAFGSYLRASELQPNNLEAKAKVGQYYLLSGDNVKAAQMADEILAKDPTYPAGNALKAAVLAGAGDVKLAIDTARQVLEKNPAQSDAASLLAGLYAREKDDANAKAVLQRAIESDRNNIQLRSVLAALATSLKDEALAEQQYVQMAAIAPRNFEYRIALASFYANANQLDKAEKTLRDAVATDAADMRRYLTLADFLAARRNPAAAITQLESDVRAQPKAVQLRVRIAQLYTAVGRTEVARQTLEEVISRDKLGAYGMRARTDLAQLAMRQGKTDEAKRLLAEVLKENPRDTPALLARAQIALDGRDPGSAIIDLRTVLRDQPDSPRVVASLADAHVANSEPALAREAIGKAIDLFPKNADLRLVLVDFLVQTNDIPGAAKAIDDAVKALPANFRLLDRKAVFEAAQRKWAAAEITASQINAAFPDNGTGYFRQGQIYYGQGKLDKAAGAFEQALKKSPRELPILIGLVNVLAEQGKREAAMSHIATALTAQPANPMLHILQGEGYVSLRKPADAERAFKIAVELAPALPAGYNDLYKLAALRGDIDAGIEVLKRGLIAIPANPVLSLSLAEGYRRKSDFDQAIATYEEILKINPRNDLVANNLSSLLADTRKDSLSLNRALELAQRFKDSGNPALLDTLGWVHFRLEQYDRAVGYLDQAVKLAPRETILQYHFGMALYKHGDTSNAKAHLRKALEAKVEFPGIEEARRIVHG